MSDGRALLVVGGGPAGMAAARAASAAGLRVTLVDESNRLGGQYFRGRQDSREPGSPHAFAAAATGVRVLLGTVVVDAPRAGALTVWNQASDHVEEIAHDRLVLATGAYDRPVAIPGWTLPGVVTAGGASTLAKAHGVAPGKRLLVAGSGPFLLSVADDLSAKGCMVEIIEASPWRASASGLGVIAMDAEIARQTAGYLARLATRRVRRRYGTMVTAIHGTDRVEAATVEQVDRDWRPISGTARMISVDGVCLGYGFVPQLELAQAIGCALERDDVSANYFVRVDAGMRTSTSEVYAAGEITGLGGKRVALAQGEGAGLTAALDAGALDRANYDVRIAPVIARLRQVDRVADWIRRAFVPRDGLWSCATPETTLCRCEDITHRAAEAGLAGNPPTPYAVKTATRAGMGLCQGRICSPILTEWLRVRHGYQPPSEERPWRIRPPLRPVPLGAWPAHEANP